MEIDIKDFDAYPWLLTLENDAYTAKHTPMNALASTLNKKVNRLFRTSKHSDTPVQKSRVNSSQTNRVDRQRRQQEELDHPIPSNSRIATRQETLERILSKKVKEPLNMRVWHDKVETYNPIGQPKVETLTGKVVEEINSYKQFLARAKPIRRDTSQLLSNPRRNELDYDRSPLNLAITGLHR